MKILTEQLLSKRRESQTTYWRATQINFDKPVGYGKTEEEAITDLKIQLYEQDEKWKDFR